MGLIQVFKSAVSSELADQYLEYFYCESLSEDILVAKGIKKNTKNSRNYGNPEVINNGSGIVVNDGQCALIVSQGAIVEVCAVPGVYTYNMSTESSVFSGSFGAGLAASFRQFGYRFMYGGEIPTDQRVYYVNTKEIMNNKFGTRNPLPFRIVDARTGIDFDLSVRCHGSYTVRIQDPILFYRYVCANINGNFRRSQISEQLKEELLNGMIPAFNEIAQKGIRYSEIGLHCEELRESIMKSLATSWTKNRGLMLVSLAFGSIDIPPEDLERIKDIQTTAVYTNASMLGAKMGLSQAKAMEAAASNTSAGPMMAFAGMNMANMAGSNTGFPFTDMLANGQPIAGPGAARYTAGTAAPANGWECPKCKTVNKGKFCMECGTKKPAGALLYKCDKCGWEPNNPENPPKFCPECGDPFNENDLVK